MISVSSSLLSSIPATSSKVTRFVLSVRSLARDLPKLIARPLLPCRFRMNQTKITIITSNGPTVMMAVTQSESSLWVKIGGQGFEVKIVDNLLWVRSESNMVGYLNSPNPFDADGWLCTGDQVEVRGEYMRILGRKSELINVGGQKVFPVEVETVLLQAENVREATVYGVKHPLMGQVVHARLSLYQPEDPEVLTERLRKFCLDHLARHKVPMRFTIVSEDEQYSERFKKIRRVSEK